MFIDSHSHIDGEEFDDDRAEVLRRARAAGVGTVVVIGTGDPHGGNFERAVLMAETYAEASDEMPALYAAVGVHPHDASLYDGEAEAKLIKLVSENKRIIAWGEIGLDYHYDNSPREIQREVFVRQIRLAREADLPVVIHTREAEADTGATLEAECAGSERAGVMHCFSGDARFATRMLELGFMISFAGNVTFRKAESLREVAKMIPLERMLIETDAPYLAPVPLRGRRNEPANVVETARLIAELRGLTIEEIGGATTANFRRFFRC